MMMIMIMMMMMMMMLMMMMMIMMMMTTMLMKTLSDQSAPTRATHTFHTPRSTYNTDFMITFGHKTILLYSLSLVYLDSHI